MKGAREALALAEEALAAGVLFEDDLVVRFDDKIVLNRCRAVEALAALEAELLPLEALDAAERVSRRAVFFRSPMGLLGYRPPPRAAAATYADAVSAFQAGKDASLLGAARALIESHGLRILGRPLGVARLDATSETIQLQFTAHPPLDPTGVMKLVQKSRGWKLAGPTKLRVECVTSEVSERAAAVLTARTR